MLSDSRGFDLRIDLTGRSICERRLLLEEAAQQLANEAPGSPATARTLRILALLQEAEELARERRLCEIWELLGQEGEWWREAIASYDTTPAPDEMERAVPPVTLGLGGPPCRWHWQEGCWHLIFDGGNNGQ